MSDYRESLFISALRSFFKGFFSFIGIFFAIFIFIIIFSSLILGKETLKPESKNTLTILPDLNDNNNLLSEKVPVVLQINIHGIIGVGDCKADKIESQLRDSRKELLKNNRVKAVLLHMDTRGGTVIDSDNIYRMLKEYKEKHKVPVYAFVDGINASGGVYITSAADKIFATPISVIGSVGVLSGPFVNLSKGMEKIGLEALTLTQGKDKDAMNPFRPWKEDESENIKMLNEYYYKRFVDIVVQSRPMLSKEKLLSTYGAHIFPAPQAEMYGYIDKGDANYKDALKALLEAANINISESYQIVTLQPKKSFIEELFESSALFKGKISHQIKVGQSFDEEKCENFSFLYTPQTY